MLYKTSICPKELYELAVASSDCTISSSLEEREIYDNIYVFFLLG
jgi:hypothetical protein